MAELATINTIQTLFESQKDQIANLLPKHVSVDRLTRIALAAISRNPKLLKCTTASLLSSMMDAAKLGLEASGPLGEGYLIPYFNGKTQTYEAQFQPGYRGLVTLARRAGVLKEIDARVIHKYDSFSIEYGVHKNLEHKPEILGNPGEPVAVYVVFQLEGGGVQFDVMRIDEVNAIRARSKSKDDGPWVTDFEEMAKKTVIKRGLKLVPMSIELAEAIEADNRVEFDLDIPTPEQEQTPYIEPAKKEKKEEKKSAPKKEEPPVINADPPVEKDTITDAEKEAVQLAINEKMTGKTDAVRKELAADLRKKYGIALLGDIKKKDLLSVLEDIQNWESANA